MKRIIVICALLSLLCILVPAQTKETTAPATESTATPLSDSDIQLLRSDVQAGKNQIITDTMTFTDPESKAFWPVYRDYANEQAKLGDERVQLIKDYAKNYETLNDSKAQELAKRLLKLDDDNQSLREEYWPKFEAAIGAKRAAKFYQVDSRLTLMINLQLSSSIPLIK